jgi:DNA repair protein RadA/Sms
MPASRFAINVNPEIHNPFIEIEIMSKPTTRFVCQECGGESLKWVGRCPYCQSWNTMVEEIEAPEGKTAISALRRKIDVGVKSPQSLNSITLQAQERTPTGIGEFDRVLGGGIVPGSLVLIGGEPGIGKSTLLLQCADAISRNNGKLLYISAEESATQIKLRADRLGIHSDNLLLYTETDMNQIIDQLHTLKPAACIVDSIQTVYKPELASAPGSVGQVRESAAQLMYLAKNENVTVFLVGHVTKDGNIAGPRVLEHLVDTVLYLEGERYQKYRILRSVKNRFGSTQELGMFEMREEGMVEVDNPSQILLSERPENSSGSIVVPSVEGTRPLMVEIQALVTPSNGFGAPRRMTSGVDSRRVSLLMAVLEKRAGLHTNTWDVFVNIAGGVTIEEPAVDLGLAASLASSFRNLPILATWTAIGEVGLSGEVRSVNWIDKRLAEASKLGFTDCVIAKGNYDPKLDKNGIKLHPVSSILEALDALGIR